MSAWAIAEARAKEEARAEYLAWEIEHFGARKTRTSKEIDTTRCACGKPVGRNGSRCSACHRKEYSKKHYTDNRERELQRAARARTRRKDRAHLQEAPSSVCLA